MDRYRRINVPIDKTIDVHFIDEKLGIYTPLKNSLLVGHPYPKGEVMFNTLAKHNIKWMINLNEDDSTYDPFPLELLHSTWLQNLSGTDVPQEPEKEWKKIDSIAQMVLEKITRGEGVAFHCKGGTGRTGTIMAKVLMLLGYTGEETLTIMDDVNSLRGKKGHGWPESTWQRGLLNSEK